MILTIKSVTDNGSRLDVLAVEGKFSAFKEINKGQPNPALPFFKPGVTADFEVKNSPDGKFHNIVGAAETASRPPAAPPAKQPAAAGRRDCSTNDSIESQTAFKGMVELIVAGKVAKQETIDLVIGWAVDRLTAV